MKYLMPFLAKYLNGEEELDGEKEISVLFMFRKI
jgi:hypothetical protein